MLAKYTRPIVSNVFPRERLFTLLDSLNEKRVIWVSGPGGSGKTTLINSYLHLRNRSCLWYQVDERDKDPATFFYYLGLAVKQASPRSRKPLPLVAPEYVSGLDTFALRFFESAYSRLKLPISLVIDNYQNIPSDSEMHRLIERGLFVTPDGATVVIIGREPPSPVFSRMQLNREIGLIEWDHLRLTEKETVGISQLQTGKRFSHETIEQLQRTIDGWTAGLLLMLNQSDLEKFDWRRIQDYTPRERFLTILGKRSLKR